MFLSEICCSNISSKTWQQSFKGVCIQVSSAEGMWLKSFIGKQWYEFNGEGHTSYKELSFTLHHKFDEIIHKHGFVFMTIK